MILLGCLREVQTYLEPKDGREREDADRTLKVFMYSKSKKNLTSQPFSDINTAGLTRNADLLLCFEQAYGSKTQRQNVYEAPT